MAIVWLSSNTPVNTLHITQVHCKAFQVTNLKNFRESYIRAMALGVTGDADVALDPRFEVHGREAVTM